MVMLTQHQRLPLTADEKLLIDIDLSILGAESARFAEYERQIELEYAWMEERQRRAGRLKILQVFLNREMIYQTTRVGELLEARARHNLQASVAALGQALTSSKP